MPEIIASLTEHETRMADSRAAAIVHAETSAGKLLADISYNQLRVMTGFNTSLEARAARAKLIGDKRKAEKATLLAELLSNRWASWQARGRPVNEVTYDKDGNPVLLVEGVN